MTLDQATIARYAPGGDIYQSLASTYGTPSADAIYAAAQTGDPTQVTAAIDQAKYGNPLNTSTADILAVQLATDPLGAPLAAADNILANTFFSFLKNPFVLLAVVLGVFLWLGGGSLIKGILTKKK